MPQYCPNCMLPVSTEDVCPHCGNDLRSTSLQPAHVLPEGTILNGRFVLGKVLGQGGFGITYIGRDLLLDMRVAVKEYYPTGYANRNSESSRRITTSSEKQLSFIKKGKEKFLREAKVLASFHGNRGIVDVRDFFEENDTAYIVMEYLDGEDLRECLRARTFAADEIFGLMKPIFFALEKIHEQGIIHRDISPDNIMMLKDGTLKLMDFGAARFSNATDDRSVSIVLKAGYAPEEQYRSKGKQGPWTDIYALCATIYKCITNIRPDDALDRLTDDHIKWPSELGFDISSAQEEVLKKGLAVKASDRFKNLHEMLLALSEAEVSKSKKAGEGSNILVEEVVVNHETQGAARNDRSLQSDEKTIAESAPKRSADYLDVLAEEGEKVGKDVNTQFLGSDSLVFHSDETRLSNSITEKTVFEEEDGKTVFDDQTEANEGGKVEEHDVDSETIDSTSVEVLTVTEDSGEEQKLASEFSESTDTRVDGDEKTFLKDGAVTKRKTSIKKKRIPYMIICLMLLVIAGFGVSSLRRSKDLLSVEANDDVLVVDEQQELENDIAGVYTVSLFVQGSEYDEERADLLKKQIQQFEKGYPGLNIDVAVVKGGEEGSIRDIQADLWCLTWEEMEEAVLERKLSPISSEHATKAFNNENINPAYLAGKFDNQLYGIPVSLNSDCILYYDKNVISEDSVGDLGRILQDCEKAGKVFQIEIGNAWYNMSFFHAAGCSAEWDRETMDGRPVYRDNLNSQNGIAAAKWIADMTKSAVFFSSSSSSDYYSDYVACFVSGPWDEANAESLYGDHMGVAVLPSFTVDGTSYSMKPFSTFYYVAVGNQADAGKQRILEELAIYLAEPIAQRQRWEEDGWIPCDVNAFSEEEKGSAAYVSALQAENSVVQKWIPDFWWDIESGLVAMIYSGQLGEDNIQECLNLYDERIIEEMNRTYPPDFTGLSEDEVYVFAGTWNGFNNVDPDYVLLKEDGVFNITISVEGSDYNGGTIYHWNGSDDNIIDYDMVVEGREYLLFNEHQRNHIVFRSSGTYNLSYDPGKKEIKIHRAEDNNVY